MAQPRRSRRRKRRLRGVARCPAAWRARRVRPHPPRRDDHAVRPHTPPPAAPALSCCGSRITSPVVRLSLRAPATRRAPVPWPSASRCRRGRRERGRADHPERVAVAARHRRDGDVEGDSSAGPVPHPGTCEPRGVPARARSPRPRRPSGQGRGASVDVDVLDRGWPGAAPGANTAAASATVTAASRRRPLVRISFSSLKGSASVWGRLSSTVRLGAGVRNPETLDFAPSRQLSGRGPCPAAAASCSRGRRPRSAEDLLAPDRPRRRSR